MWACETLVRAGPFGGKVVLLNLQHAAATDSPPPRDSARQAQAQNRSSKPCHVSCFPGTGGLLTIRVLFPRHLLGSVTLPTYSTISLPSSCGVESSRQPGLGRKRRTLDLAPPTTSCTLHHHDILEINNSTFRTKIQSPTPNLKKISTSTGEIGSQRGNSAHLVQ